MKKQLRKRVMAVALTLLMVVGMLPAEFLGGSVAVSASEVTIDGEKTIIEFNASTLPDGDISAEMVINDYITLSASSEFRYTVDANNKTAADGSLSFTKRLKSNGASGEADRTITFYAPGPGTVIVYMMSANSSDSSRKLGLYNAETGTMVDGQEHKAPVKAGENGVIEPFEYVVPEAGTYRLKANAAINVYYMKGEFNGVGEPPAQRPAWDSVPDPVINSVTINEAGTIDVDVDVLIGSEGADSARLIMFQDNFEVTSVAVQEPGVYTIAPITEGDFKFKLISYRTGCADKESLLKLVKDYKLPLVAPDITWINNLGDGAVYVDWNNIDAEKFEIAYKKQGDADYTVVASDLKEGDYTLKDLEEGKTYEVKVTATKDGNTSEAVKSITVGDPEQQWYVAAIGSATSGKMTVNGQEYEVKSSAELTEVADVTNSDGTVGIASATNGKIADSEDGFFYYFTKVDPNTENFKLTATFTVTNTDDGPDNQTGYGIYATDIAGIGSKDTKYFNSVSVGQFKMQGGYYHANGARIITGYTAYDALNNVGATRNFNNTNIFTKMNTGDDVVVGDVVTYTLEKTNEGYVASMEGAEETITFDGTTSIMTQEDGSICVGVMAARKVGVEISDIKFEKSEGTAGGESVILTEPVFKVYSSTTTGTSAYEFIASSNVAGTLEVAEQTITMEPNKVVKIPFELTVGYNSFPYKFTPDSKVENLTTYNSVSGTLSPVLKQIGKEGETIYVSPTGVAEGKGTESAPLDLQTAINYAQPGQIIVMMDGTYKPNADLVIGRSVNGTAEKPITLMAQNPGSVIIDGGALTSSTSILSVVGSYWHIYGLEVTNGPAKGISICGNNNIIEMCTVHKVGNSGFQVSRFAGEPNDSEMWPTNNLIKNCEAYDCCDEGRNDADGFAAKLTCGEGNKFYGCIAHHNVDDGWDLYAKSTTGPIGTVTIENCVAYNNGFLTTDDPTDPSTEFGEGNGFKLGGENLAGGHKLINCVSFANYAKGITSNSCPDCEVINCTAFNNSLNGKAYNVSLYTKTSNPKAWVLEGMLSVAENTTTTAELGSNNGVIYSLRTENNYLFDGAGSYNSMGVKATSAWFENTDVTVVPTRNADGTIDMHGLLVLTADAPSGTGAKIVTSGDDAISVQPQITTVVSEVSEAPAGSDGATDGKGGTSPALPIGIGVVAVAAAAGAVVLKKKKK